jgi:hypothetical protein
MLCCVRGEGVLVGGVFNGVIWEIIVLCSGSILSLLVVGHNAVLRSMLQFLTIFFLHVKHFGFVFPIFTMDAPLWGGAVLVLLLLWVP